jgi:hypothetical protein
MAARYSRATATSSRAALVDERLEGLLRVGHRGQLGREAHPAGKRFDRFEFALLKRAAQVDLGPAGLARAVKVGGENGRRTPPAA